MSMFWEAQMITFKVKDFENVRSFYKAVLSLRILEEEPGLFVVFELGNIKLGLEKEEGELDTPEIVPIWCNLTVHVRSMTDIIESVRALGVEYNLYTVEDLRKLEVSDPEGHMLTFVASV